MFQAKLYVDFDTPGTLDEVTREFDEPFDVLEEEIHDDGTITFAIYTGGHQEHFVERLSDEPGVYEVRRLDSETLVVRKEAKGATVAIRENHGKLNGVDRVHGTKRVFEVLLFRREDLQTMIEDLRELGDVRLNSLVEMTSETELLSDRQHEVVRTAMKMGFYEWPRAADSTAVAEELDVTHPTVLEHLRKAERKLIERALDDSTRTSHEDREYLLTTE